MQLRVASPALLLALTLAATLIAALPVALAEDTHQHREHGVHQHGVGSLNLVLDGHLVEIALESPAANLVGFEHAPKDAAERAALERSVAKLRDGERLFAFPSAAACRLAESSVSSALLEQGSASQEDQAHWDAQSPDADHDGDPDHETHADLDADYRFACTHPEKIDRLEVRLFALFPATQRLLVQYTTGQGQGAAELTPAKTRIDL